MAQQPAHELEKMPSVDNHIEDSTAAHHASPTSSDLEQGQGQSKLMSFYSHPWTQILLISMICFCLPGVCQQT